jgi:protein phosphatase 2C
VSIVERCPDDECLVLASDGLWDVFGSSDAAALALSRLQSAAAEGLCGAAAARAAAGALVKAALERGSRDNITALVVDLRPRPAAAGADDGRPGGGRAGVKDLAAPKA